MLLNKMYPVDYEIIVINEDYIEICLTNNN